MDVLDLRDLNRATLARQCLLERSGTSVADLVRQVGGLQAQTPANPAVSLWSRMSSFDRTNLVSAVRRGSLVRGTTLRGTLHLHHVDEYRELRMSLQPMLDGMLRGTHRRVDVDDIEPARQLAQRLLHEEPRTIGALKHAFADRFPNSDAQALSHVARYGMQLLMVPDTDMPNGWPNVARFTPATSLIEGDLSPVVSPELVLRRFLEVLGPGSVRDAQTWSGVRGLKQVAADMERDGELITLTTYEGDDLYDLPDAPRPSGDTPAGVRFLPMWDNLLLSHHDRSRVIDPTSRPYLASRNGMPPPTYLVDGFVHGTWTTSRTGGRATLQLSPFTAIPTAAQDALVREGTALLEFLEPDADKRDVRLG